MFKSEIEERYKNIKKTELSENFIVFDCFADDTFHFYVRIIFDKERNKVCYSGDVGSFVFGGNIVNICQFFKYDVNLGYWLEKVEAYSENPFQEEIFEEDLERVLVKYLEDYGIDNVEKHDKIKHILSKIDYHHYIHICDVLREELEDYIDTDDIGRFVWEVVGHSRQFSKRYIYCCELLHYISEKYL